jgi:hypothetical protein
MTALDGPLPGRTVNIMAKTPGQTGEGTARNNGQLSCEVARDFDSSKKIDHIGTMGGILHETFRIDRHCSGSGAGLRHDRTC